MSAETFADWRDRMQVKVDAIYANRHRITVVRGPDKPNGPNGARYPSCGTCERPVAPNGRGGWRHLR